MWKYSLWIYRSLKKPLRFPRIPRNLQEFPGVPRNPQKSQGILTFSHEFTNPQESKRVVPYSIFRMQRVTVKERTVDVIFFWEMKVKYSERHLVGAETLLRFLTFALPRLLQRKSRADPFSNRANPLFLIEFPANPTQKCTNSPEHLPFCLDGHLNQDLVTTSVTWNGQQENGHFVNIPNNFLALYCRNVAA